MNTDEKRKKQGKRELQGLMVDPDHHGPSRADHAAKLTGAALAGIEGDTHLRALHGQGSSGAQRSAGPALKTELLVARHFVGRPLHFNAGIFEVFDALLKILGMAPELHDNEPFLPGINSGLEQVELQVKVLDQPVNDGLVHYLLGKPQYEHFSMHGKSLN
jgi:hypothetical protein